MWLLLQYNYTFKTSRLTKLCLAQSDIEAAVKLLLALKLDYKKVTGQDYKAGCPPTNDGTPSDNGPASEEGDDMVNPWAVSTSSAKGVDYDKLIGMDVLT